MSLEQSRSKGDAKAHAAPRTILLSAYACDPREGSESRLGWKWAEELARLGHRVTVLTRSSNVADASAAAAELGLKLSVVGYDLPLWVSRWKRGGLGVWWFYKLWQWRAYYIAKELVRSETFDLIHHVTYGKFDEPSYMGFLGPPFVISTGGGVLLPPRFYQGLPLRANLKERLRALLIRTKRFDPYLRRALEKSTLIICRTQECVDALPRSVHARSVVLDDVGVTPIRHLGTSWMGSPDFLYVGRLVAWKGLHLALEALALFRAEVPAATLTVIGTGADRPWFRKRAAELGLTDAVRWVGHIPHAEVLRFYRSHAAMIFPSLHDSGPQVIPEAYGSGLPVICLNYAGPGQLLPDGCGVKVPIEEQSQGEVVLGLTDGMRDVFIHRGRYAQACVESASDRTWAEGVRKTYEVIEARVFAAKTS